MHTHFNFKLGAQELASLSKWLQTDAAAERQKQQVESGSKSFSLWNAMMTRACPETESTVYHKHDYLTGKMMANNKDLGVAYF